MQLFRWGVIGPGSIAHQFAQALAISENGALAAVASRNRERAQAFADQYGASVVYDSYEALWSSSEVDGIYIATPHSHHFAPALQCLKAGKHVLLEKPLTVNAGQTQQLIDASEACGVVFQEALWSRFMPCFAKIKSWLSNGAIGELQYITSQIGFYKEDRADHRLLDPARAGGAILDLGVYSVSLSQFLLAEYPSEIQAMGSLHPNGVDRHVLANLRYPSGVLSQFTCTIGAECANTMTLHGRKGQIHIKAPFWNGLGATLVRADGSTEQEDYSHMANGFEYQIEGVMQAAAQGQLCAPVMSHADSLNVMQTLDEIRAQIGLKYATELEAQ